MPTTSNHRIDADALPVTRPELGAVVDQMLEGFQIIDRAFRYVYVNDAVLVHARNTRAALLGRRMNDVYPGIDQTPLYATLEHCMRERVPAELENAFTYPDGSVGWFDLRITPVSEGLAILSLDVTARKALEVELRQSQRLDAAGRMAANLGHDFRNLLSVIRGACRLAHKRSPPDGPANEDLELALQATERASELTQQLLSFCRQRPVAPQIVDLARELDTLAPLAARALDRQHRLDLTLDAAPPVWIDPSALEQVVLNLVRNAAQAMPDGGTIDLRLDALTLDALTLDAALTGRHRAQPGDVRAESADRAIDGVTLPPGRYVRLSVIDTGVGMTPDVAAHVFEPFFTTKDHQSGSGLGLSICYGIVRQAGGAIGVISAPGEGTTFTVYLPAYAGPA